MSLREKIEKMRDERKEAEIKYGKYEYTLGAITAYEIVLAMMDDEPAQPVATDAELETLLTRMYGAGYWSNNASDIANKLRSLFARRQPSEGMRSRSEIEARIEDLRQAGGARGHSGVIADAEIHAACRDALDWVLNPEPPTPTYEPTDDEPREGDVFKAADGTMMHVYLNETGQPRVQVRDFIMHTSECVGLFGKPHRRVEPVKLRVWEGEAVVPESGCGRNLKVVTFEGLQPFYGKTVHVRVTEIL